MRHNNFPRPISPYTTEGIKYAGSKRTIIPDILQVLSQLPICTVIDGFAGTTRVGQALKFNSYRVLSNDKASWSKVTPILLQNISY